MPSVLNFELVGELSRPTSKAEFEDTAFFAVAPNRAQYVPGQKIDFLSEPAVNIQTKCLVEPIKLNRFTNNVKNFNINILKHLGTEL
ncbi:hypothetical protein ABM34_05510 [Companilactobacillus ginsenosidimutans]|uniref:Uncharacterized protein n=1 Tax=Companilactobacillus ginsenosidimutans TaxID=1007676 RepID=A0A0H4QJ34_9LACO|nr:hypothetical protein ABM34_05510 [Companilactobacillus ginsenosidimutans]